jgi:hypothetical protein
VKLTNKLFVENLANSHVLTMNLPIILLFFSTQKLHIHFQCLFYSSTFEIPKAFSITTFSITTLSITTLNIMALSIMTLSITTFSITILSITLK